MHRYYAFSIVLGLAALSACGGGGGGSSSPGAPAPVPTSTPTVSSQQVISVALPQSAIGQETDPTFGLIGGYTQTEFSQVLGFAPGSQVMIRNAQSSTPHTLGDTGQQSFPVNQPPTLSVTGTGTTTLSAGWQSGTLNPGQVIGPITLSSGTYYIGCAYHYQSNNMRDVLVVAAAATPGPQATVAPGGAPSPQPSSPGGYGY